jgi:hypothetical protein
LDSDGDSGFLFEPLADRRQALPFGFSSSYLRPQGAQLTSFELQAFSRAVAPDRYKTLRSKASSTCYPLCMEEYERETSQILERFLARGPEFRGMYRGFGRRACKSHPNTRSLSG